MPDNSNKPNILITNDDGIHAPGLRALVGALQDQGTVTVVAPSHERSAAAQSLTLRQPIYCDQIAEREYSIEGTPADAVIIATRSLALASAQAESRPLPSEEMLWICN